MNIDKIYKGIKVWKKAKLIYLEIYLKATISDLCNVPLLVSTPLETQAVVTTQFNQFSTLFKSPSLMIDLNKIESLLINNVVNKL